MRTDDRLIAAYTKGRSCSDADLASAEHHLAAHPDDLNARVTVLGAKLERDLNAFCQSDEYAEHLVWIARNHPDTSIWQRVAFSTHPSQNGTLHGELATIWLNHVRSPDAAPSVLKNAASFFAASDPARAIEILKRAAELEPKDHGWPLLIGLHLLSAARIHAYPLPNTPAAALGPPCDIETSRAALTWFDKAAALLSRREAPDEWIGTGQLLAAIACQDWTRAESLAHELLNHKRRWFQPPFTGNIAFHANRALGHIALRNGDVETAKQRLQASAKCGPSPQLSSFGPSMSLAFSLLARGERDAVLGFIDACASFWTLGGDYLKTWRAGVERGDLCDFGHHYFM